MLIASCTGHRPQSLLCKFNEKHIQCLEIKQILMDLINKVYLEGYKWFLFGGALGVDQWWAEAVLELKELHSDVKLCAAVPFAGQESIWPAKSQERYKDILRKADGIFVVNENKRVLFEDLQPKPLKNKWEASKYLNQRNEWMVDRSSLVISVFNGEKGGTANCTNYAIKKGKKVVRYNPDSKLIEIINDKGKLI